MYNFSYTQNKKKALITQMSYEYRTAFKSTDRKQIEELFDFYTSISDRFSKPQIIYEDLLQDEISVEDDKVCFSYTHPTIISLQTIYPSEPNNEKILEGIRFSIENNLNNIIVASLNKPAIDCKDLLDKYDKSKNDEHIL